MKRKTRRIFLIYAIVIASVGVGLISMTSEESDSLFTLMRSIDDNVLHYELNVEGGELSEDKPIRYFWKLAGYPSKTKDLNSIQRNFVYGIKYTSKKDDYYEFHLHAYKHNLYLKKSSLGTYHVLSKFEGKVVIVNHIFIQVDKLGSLAKLPKVPYVDVHWYSPKDKVHGVTRVDVNKK